MRFIYFLLFVSFNVFAESYWVEMIVFRNAPGIQTEKFASDFWSVNGIVAKDKPLRLTKEAESLKKIKKTILLHQAFEWDFDNVPTKFIVKDGVNKNGQHDIQGSFSIRKLRKINLNIDLWVNRFNDNKFSFVKSVEHVSFQRSLQPNQLHYFDDASIGILLHIAPIYNTKKKIQVPKELSEVLGE